MNPLEHPDKPLNDVHRERPAHPRIDLPPVPDPVVASSKPANPDQPHNYAHPTLDPPKKTYHPKRVMISLGVVVIVCLLAVATMVAVALLPMQQQKKADTSNDMPAQLTEKTISAKQVIAHVKEYFKAEGVAKNGISLPVRATGKDFYTVIPEASATVSVAGNVAPDKTDSQLKSIIHSLEGDGFTQQTSGYEPESSNYLASFVRPETVCQVEVVHIIDKSSSHWTEVRCADMATYEEYAKAQEPLVRLYTPLSATSVLYGFIGKPSPVASKTTGYSTAELPVSIVIDSTMTSHGTLALYYQVPSGLWTYWRDRDASAVFACDQYNTNELKSAYFGAPCRDTGTNTMSVVAAPKKL